MYRTNHAAIKSRPFLAPPKETVSGFDPLQRYLMEIGRLNLLTRKEEKELALEFRQTGDVVPVHTLVTSNLRLVVKIALEFQRVWLQNLLDLIQEGNIGLIRAAWKFDPRKNVKFSYYASFWIKAYMLKFIMDNWRMVKIGTTQGQRRLFFKLKKEKQKLTAAGISPKPQMIARRLGVSMREVIEMEQRLEGWDISLDAPLKDHSESERIEFFRAETDSIEIKMAKKEMKALLHHKVAQFRKGIDAREQEILDRRICADVPATLQELGERHGISRERVRQLEKRIVAKLRDYFKREISDFDAYV